MKTKKWIPFLLAIAGSGAAVAALRAAEHASVGYTDTPKLPGGKWHVHGPDRPQPVEGSFLVSPDQAGITDDISSVDRGEPPRGGHVVSLIARRRPDRKNS